MTKTLTTKVLNDFIAGQGYGVAPSAVEAMAREILGNREAQPVADGENCWSCGKFFTYAQHSECDGYCPHCNTPVDLDAEDLDDEA